MVGQSVSERSGELLLPFIWIGQPSRLHARLQLTLPHAAVTQRDHVGQENGYDGRHAGTSDTSDGASHAELHHVLRHAAPKAAEPKDDIGKQETLLAAKDVAELAVERLEAGQGEEVAGHGVRETVSEAVCVVVVVLTTLDARNLRRRDPAGRVERIQIAANLGIYRRREELFHSGKVDLVWRLGQDNPTQPCGHVI